jgi:carbonic anhydrase
VQDVRIKHALWLDRIEDETQRHNALVELNAIEQAVNVCNTTVIQDAWDRGQDIVIHGWVYALHNGLLQDLRMAISRPDEVQSVFEQALHRVHERYSEYVTVPAPL